MNSRRKNNKRNRITLVFEVSYEKLKISLIEMSRRKKKVLSNKPILPQGTHPSQKFYQHQVMEMLIASSSIIVNVS